MNRPPPIWRWLTWVLLGVGAAVVAPLLLRFGPTWLAGLAESRLQVEIFAAACLLAAAWAGYEIYGREKPRAWVEALVIGTCFAAYFGLLLLLNPTYSRETLVFGSALAAGVLLLPVLFRAVLSRRVGILTLSLPLLLLGATWLVGGARAASVHGRVAGTSVLSSRYTVRLQTRAGYLRKPRALGGDLELLEGDPVLVTGDGDFYRITASADSFAVRPIDARVPINGDDFRWATPDAVNRSWFRVAGLHFVTAGDDLKVITVHHFWKKDRRCFVVRVSAFQTTVSAFLGGKPAGRWSTLYETHPCLPLGTPGDRSFAKRRNLFSGHQIGGRIVDLGGGRILVAIGDHEFDGWNWKQMYPQDRDADYGKTLEISLADGSARIFTLGHRNPQGLAIDGRGRIWETEHGPRGGDELNLLQDGANYGWPLTTYGTEYDMYDWPLQQPDSLGPAGRAPVFAWVPSIGVSDLVALRGDAFREWKGDLLIGSLVDESLWRVRIREGRAVFTERIPVGERIRDLIELRDGRVLMWTDAGDLVIASPAPPGRSGQLVFSQCVACHESAGEGRSGLGPPLSGVVGRRVASVPGYPYSHALRSLGGVWSKERLDAFISDPHEFAPGTTMSFAGIRDQASRAALLEYLGGLR